MPSNYPFLARNQKTEEQRQKDNINALWDQLGTMGATGKQSFFTGFGEDNQFQANRPTGILNTNQGPRTVHEAERVDIQPNGEFSVTPASQIGGQEKLMRMEENQDMPGYQLGTPDKQLSSITDTYKPYTDRALQRLEGYATSESPVNKSIREGERERFAGEAASAKGALSQELSQIGVSGREAATEEARLGRQIGAQESQMMTDLRKQESQQAFTAAQQLPGQIATARGIDISKQQWEKGADIASQQWEKAFEFDKERYKDTKAWTDFEYTAQYGSDKDVMEAYKIATGRDLNPNAVGEIRGYARSKRAQDVTAGQLQNLAAQYGIDQSQMENLMYAINSGATREMVNSRFGTNLSSDEFNQLSRDFRYQGGVQAATLTGMNIQNTAAQLGVDTAQLEAMVYAVNHGATMDMVNGRFGTNLTVDEFTKLSRDFDYESNVQTANLDAMSIQNAASRLGVDADRFKTFVDVVNSGGDLESANMTSGLRLSAGQWEDVRRNYSYEGQLQEQNLASARNKVGDEVFDSIKERIASGVPIEMINTEFDTNLGPYEYQAIRRTTALGTREYEQNLSAVGMLLQSEDPQNIITAQNILQNDVFPNVPFSVDQLIRDVGADRAAKALTDLSTLASTFGSWDEAQQSITQLGLLDNLNMNIDEAKQLFDSLKINALDEEWKAIRESEFFQSLEPDKQDLIKETLTAGLTGELEFNIQPVYNVVTPEGDFVQSFTSVADANKFINDNPDGNYSTQKASNYVYKNLASGDTVVVNNMTGEAATTTGGTVSINDAWGNFQDSMENIPEAEQPIYSQFKTAWINAGSPSNFTYDDYLKQTSKAGGEVISNITEKYKNGWPTLTLTQYSTEDNVANKNKIWDTKQRDEILSARQNFMATPENTREINPDNSKEIFNDIYNTLNQKQNDGSVAFNPIVGGVIGDAGDDYRESNLIYLEGIDAPYMMSGVMEFELNPQKPGYSSGLKAIQLYNLKDGSIIMLDNNGNLRSSPGVDPNYQSQINRGIFS
ncbi:MAG: hypothetical protein ACWGNI_00085 [Desulfobacterales bacterium]